MNGEKVGRVYNDWIYIALPKGRNKVEVTLNTNSHKDYYFNGQLIKDEIIVEEDRDGKEQHHH